MPGGVGGEGPGSPVLPYPDQPSRASSPAGNVSTQGRPGVYIGPMNTAESVDAAIGSRPLIGRTLVVTRAAAQAEGLVNALEALGARVVRPPGDQNRAPRGPAGASKRRAECRRVRVGDFYVGQRCRFLPSGGGGRGH